MTIRVKLCGIKTQVTNQKRQLQFYSGRASFNFQSKKFYHFPGYNMLKNILRL